MNTTLIHGFRGGMIEALSVLGLLLAAATAMAADPPLLLGPAGRERTVRLPDGRLAAMYVRTDGTSGAVYSSDEGLTWTAPRAVPSGATVKWWMVQTMLDSNGSIHGFYKEPRGDFSDPSSATISTEKFLDIWHVQTTPEPLTIQNSASFSYKYEMDQDPGTYSQIDLDANSLDDFLGTSGIKNTGVSGATDGRTITINSNRPSPSQFYNATGGTSIWDTVNYSAEIPYTVEVRIKRISGDVHLGSSANGISDGWLDIGTVGQQWGFEYPTPLGTQDNTNDFHTFRIAYSGSTNGDSFWVWRDSELLNSGLVLTDGYTAGTVKRLVLGSISTTYGTGVTEIDYLRFTQGAYAPPGATTDAQQWGSGSAIHLGWEGGMQGQPIQLSNGRIVLPMQEWQGGVPLGPPTGPNYVTTLYSDDDGATWIKSDARLVAPVDNVYNGVGAGMVEPVMLQLNDQRLWMLMRTQTGKLYETFSSDGTTWSDATPTPFHSSNAPAQLIRMADGRIVMFWCNAQVIPRVSGQIVQSGRDALHAAVSHDDGQTWVGFREVLLYPDRNQSPPQGVDFGAGYPIARLNVDGTMIHLTTGQLNRYALWIDPDWLEEKSHSDDFSNGLGQWSTFKRVGSPEPGWQARVPGAELIADPMGSGNQVLHLRKDNLFEPADGATWNFPAGQRGVLTMPVMIRSGFDGGVVALEDRFFDPIDANSESDAIFSFRINSNGRLGGGSTILPFDQWITLKMFWDAEQGWLKVIADETQALLVDMNDQPFGGVSYLHLRSSAFLLDSDGFMIRSVSVVIPEPGDANGDGMVNLSDLQVLGDNWQSISADWTTGDFNGDGIVDLSDLQVMGDNWGMGTVQDIAFSEALGLADVHVPEPTTCVYVGFALIMVFQRSLRRNVGSE
ncbi:MAG: exo-alpha-sialidase [Phycisphaeraceae bacterium]|nr:exo-alpha-sialidase [Phycisphaeraceae bacterium]